MSEQVPSPQHEEQPSQNKDFQKKLQKREQLLLERLQEAREAQLKAMERFRRAEARLQKRMNRVQRVEGRLTLIRQQLDELRTPTSMTTPAPVASEPRVEEEAPTQETRQEEQWLTNELHAAEAPSVEEPTGREAPTEDQLLTDELHAAESMPAEGTLAGDQLLAEELLLTETLREGEPQPAEGTLTASGLTEIAREGRATAAAAEQAARAAAVRAVEAAARVEQFGSGRHLAQELLQLQSEADTTSLIAQEAKRAAQEAERLAAQDERAAQEMVAETATSQQTQSQGVEETQPPSSEETAVGGEVADAPGFTDTSESDNQEREVTHSLVTEESEAPEVQGKAPTSGDRIDETRPLMPESIEQIEEEEEIVESITAMTIARVTAAAAAEAEALAEASSVRTREARRLARQADQTLLEVHIAMRSGALHGEDAEIALQNAEQAVTRAQAILADAEAAEEQALRAAMDAEAEAEVAEGMAFAVNKGVEPGVDEAGDAQPGTEDWSTEMEISDEPTVKIQTMLPEEHE